MTETSDHNDDKNEKNSVDKKTENSAVAKKARFANRPAGGGVKLNQRRRARKLILQALYQWQLAQATVTDIEAEFRAHNEGRMDWDFFHEVFSAIPAMVSELDAHFEPFLDRKVDDLDPIELAILRMGVFEFVHRIDVPYKVVINELVELAKVFGATDSHKYINGILDKASKVLRPLEMGPQRTSR